MDALRDGPPKRQNAKRTIKSRELLESHELISASFRLALWRFGVDLWERSQSRDRELPERD
jgi:hypothetical protein